MSERDRIQAFQEEIERRIDSVGVGAALRETLNDFAEVCREKAEHLRSNWQDDEAASDWDRIALELDEALIEDISPLGDIM